MQWKKTSVACGLVSIVEGVSVCLRACVHVCMRARAQMYMCSESLCDWVSV